MQPRASGFEFVAQSLEPLAEPHADREDAENQSADDEAGHQAPLDGLRPSFIQQQSLFAAIVTHADGTLVTIEQPAAPGETVVIYATGLGELDPPVAAGAANPGLGGESVASVTDPQVLVLFNRALAQTVFAGGTPGFAGLYQINATIPADVPAGTNALLAVLTSNAFHDQVDIPISEATVASIKSDDRAQPRTLYIRIPPRSRVQ